MSLLAGVRRAKAERRQMKAIDWIAVRLEEEAEEIVNAVVEQAKAGDWRAGAWLFDRVYGKPQEHVELETKEKDWYDMTPAELARRSPSSYASTGKRPRKPTMRERRRPRRGVLVSFSSAPRVHASHGKSHPGEFASAMKAKDPCSIERIRAALEETRSWLGLDIDLDSWTGRHYQSANRLAHLYWLRRLSIDAWLVHLLFCDDTTQGAKATSRECWDEDLPPIAAALGDPKTEYAEYVFLPARAPDELHA